MCVILICDNYIDANHIRRLHCAPNVLHTVGEGHFRTTLRNSTGQGAQN